MDTSNRRPPAQGVSGAVGDFTMECDDWRAQLQRTRIVNKIMDILKMHLPFSRYERLQELKKIAERVEEEIYTAATSQSEYSRKICLHMLVIETRLQDHKPNFTRSKSATISENLSVPFNSTTNDGDWQYEVYQKIKTMKDLYFLDLRPTLPRGAFGGPTMDSGSWRAQLLPESRQRIVYKIVDTMKKHIPFDGHEGLHELNKIAVRFEDRMYIDSTSQSDYLRKISLKMLTLETDSQNPAFNGASLMIQD